MRCLQQNRPWQFQTERLRRAAIDDKFKVTLPRLYVHQKLVMF